MTGWIAIGVSTKKAPAYSRGQLFQKLRPALIYSEGLFGAGLAGVGLVGAGVAGVPVPAGGAIVLAGGRVSFAAGLVPFCPVLLPIPNTTARTIATNTAAATPAPPA